MRFAATLRVRLASILRRLAAALETPAPRGLPADAKPEISFARTFTVGDRDMSHDGETRSVHWIEGFPTREIAREYACRNTWASVEELRQPGQSRADLRILWIISGHACWVLDDTYCAHDNLDYFFDNPAAPWQRDYGALDPANAVSSNGGNAT